MNQPLSSLSSLMDSVWLTLVVHWLDTLPRKSLLFSLLSSLSALGSSTHNRLRPASLTCGVWDILASVTSSWALNRLVSPELSDFTTYL